MRTEIKGGYINLWSGNLGAHVVSKYPHPRKVYIMRQKIETGRCQKNKDMPYSRLIKYYAVEFMIQDFTNVSI